MTATSGVGDGRVRGRATRAAKPSVLVVYRRGRAGEVALAEGAGVLASSAAALTVVTLAPQDSDPGCTVYAGPYNAGVREQASTELIEARRLLGALGERAHY